MLILSDIKGPFRGRIKIKLRSEDSSWQAERAFWKIEWLKSEQGY